MKRLQLLRQKQKQKQTAKTNNPLPLKLRLKFHAFKYGLYAFIFLMIGAFAFLLDKHVEAIFLFVSYVFLRYRFPKTFHHPNTYWCVFWSIMSFWLCIVTILPLHLSVLSSVIVAILLCYILYKVKDHIDIKKENEKLKEELSQKKPFSIYNCSREEFDVHCLEKGVRRDRLDYVWDILRSSLSVNELAEKHFVEPQTIKQDRWRYKKKIS